MVNKRYKKYKKSYKAYRENNKSFCNELCRKYYEENKERLTKLKQIYRSNHKKEHNLEVKKYGKKFPKKISARSIARSLKIIPKCEICSSKKNLQRHHLNYNKPKLIIPLCIRCHNKLHKLANSYNRIKGLK